MNAPPQIASQVLLIADIIDMELTLVDPVANSSKASLTQTFPFEGCPPTKTGDLGRQSHGLALLLAAVDKKFDALSAADQQSLRKVVRVVTGAFSSSMSHWSVGIGLEGQLQGAIHNPHTHARPISGDPSLHQLHCILSC